MGVKRYELSEAQRVRTEPLLPGKASDPGRTGSDNRLFVNGVLWVLRSGAHWQDLPERYGKGKTAHKRFSRWAAAGVWEKVFGDLIKDRDNQYLMLDSTLVRAHQQATTGRGYDAGSLRRHLDQIGAVAVIPSNRSRKVPIPHDPLVYKLRNRIERCFNRLKHFRRFATRFDRLASHYLAFIHIAASMLWMR